MGATIRPPSRTSAIPQNLRAPISPCPLSPDKPQVALLTALDPKWRSCLLHLISKLLQARFEAIQTHDACAHGLSPCICLACSPASLPFNQAQHATRRRARSLRGPPAPIFTPLLLPPVAPSHPFPAAWQEIKAPHLVCCASCLGAHLVAHGRSAVAHHAPFRRNTSALRSTILLCGATHPSGLARSRSSPGRPI